MHVKVLFCLPAKNNALSGYYDLNAVVSPDLTASIPSEVHTVFWECVPQKVLSDKTAADSI